MKKQKKLKLDINKVSISNLNNIKGGNPIISVDICALTEGPDCALTEAFSCTCLTIDDVATCVPTSVTGATIINNSGDRRC